MAPVRGINEWVGLCMLAIYERCNLKPSKNNNDSLEILKDTFRMMYEAAREFGYKDGYIEGLGKASNYKSKEYLQKAYYTDENGDVLINEKTFEPMKIDLKEDLNKY